MMEKPETNIIPDETNQNTTNKNKTKFLVLVKPEVFKQIFLTFTM